MSFCIEIDDKVTFKVKGFMNDASGRPAAFDFALTARRMDTDEFKATIDRLSAEGDGSLVEFFVDITTGWAGVNDGDGKPVPFSEGALTRICKVPGMAAMIFRAYASEAGAKEKN